MGMFLFFFFFPAAIAVWYFVTKKMKASGKGLSRHVAGFFAGFFAWLVVCMIAIYSEPNEREKLAKSNADVVAAEKSKQAQEQQKLAQEQVQEQQKQEQLTQAQQKEQEQKAADEQSAEVQKLSEWHQSSMAKYNEMEQASVQLANAFTAKKVDLYKAYESAETLRALAKRVQYDIEPIALKNEKADKNAKNYVENIRSLAFIRGQVADLSMSVANGDKDFKPSDQAELKKLISSAQAASLMAAASIMSAYENLEIKPEQIDYKKES